MYWYYAVLNSAGICTSVEMVEEEIDVTGSTDFVEITEEQYTSQSVVGVRYDFDSQSWVQPTVGELKKHTTNEIQYKNENKWLSTKLDEMEAEVDTKAPWNSVSVLTQAEYNAISSPVATTLYLIKEV